MRSDLALRDAGRRVRRSGCAGVCTPTANVGSVSTRIFAPPFHDSVTLPTRLPSGAITGMSTAMPCSVPLSIVSVESKLPGSRSDDARRRFAINARQERKVEDLVQPLVVEDRLLGVELLPLQLGDLVAQLAVIRFRWPESVSPAHQSPIGRATELTAPSIGETTVWAPRPSAPSGPCCARCGCRA